MSNILENLQSILTAVYGKDVRQAIHDAIHDCYEDGSAGSTDLIARESIEELESTKADKTELEAETTARVAEVADERTARLAEVAVERARIDNLLSQESVSNGTLVTRTELLGSAVAITSNSTSEATATIDLNDLISNYQYIEITYSFADGYNETARFKPATASGVGVHFSSVKYDNTVSSSATALTLAEVKVVASTVSSKTRLTVNAVIWGWSGSSSANGALTSYIGSGANLRITSVVGFKYEDAGNSKDTELTDLRTGANGVTYDTAGVAVRSQISAIDSELDTVESDLATVETSATSAQAYAVGDLLVYDGVLYKATSAIEVGDTIEVGTNVTTTTIEAVINDKFSQLNADITAISGNTIYSITESGYYRLGSSTVDTTNIGSGSAYKHTSIECTSGDVFTISGSSYGAGARMYAFIDSENNILAKASQGATLTNEVITAPIYAVGLLVNDYNGTVRLYSGKTVAERFSDVEKDLTYSYDYESGSYLDADGVTKTNNKYRVRKATPLLIDDVVAVIAPHGYYLYAFLLDADKTLISIYASTWKTRIDTLDLPSDVKYINFAVKNASGSELTNYVDEVADGIIIKHKTDRQILDTEEYKKAYYPYAVTKASGSWKNRVNVLHITDCHAGTSDALKNVTDSVKLGNALLSDGKISLVVNTGDSTNGSTMTKSTFLAQLDDVVAEYAESNVPYLSCLGNHDYNDGFSDTTNITNVPTNAELWTHGFAPLANQYSDIVFGATNRHYSYIDITSGDYTVRFIMLDMGDHADYTSESVYRCQWNTVYSQDQIDWLANTALNVSDGYGVVICNHFPFAPYRANGYSETYPALNDGYFVQSSTGVRGDGWKMIPEIVQAWQNRTTISKTYTDTSGSQNIVADYDFSDIGSNALFICYLTGHTHSKNVYQVREEGGDTFNQLMLCEDSSGLNGTALSNTYKTLGTASDNAFSMLSIDMAEKKIYRTSYGVYKKYNDPTVEQTQVFDILTV